MTTNDLALCGVANLVHTDGVASMKSASYGLASGANEPGTRSSAGEHALHTGGVVGSIPTASTIRQPLSGVYFLFRRGVLTYSGKSRDVYSRLRSHRRNGRQFDYWLIASCPIEDIDWIETAFIRKLAPEENVAKVLRPKPIPSSNSTPASLPPDDDMIVTLKGAMDYAKHFRRQSAVRDALQSGLLPSRRDAKGVWMIRVGDLKAWCRSNR